MDWTLHGASMYWPEGEKTEHTIRMNLDVSLEDIADAKSIQSIRMELALVESGIHRRLMSVFAEEVIPHLLTLSKKETRVPESVEFSCFDRWRCTPLVIDDSDLIRRGLVVRNELQLLLDIVTSKPLTAVQVTNVTRTAIASALTSAVVSELELKYLGRTGTPSHSAVIMQQDGKLTDYFYDNSTDNPSSN